MVRQVAQQGVERARAGFVRVRLAAMASPLMLRRRGRGHLLGFRGGRPCRERHKLLMLLAVRLLLP